jgi:hypothetical protein
MEQLEAVDPGGQVLVRDQNTGTHVAWDRVSDGLARNGVTLPLSKFTGAVASSLVLAHLDPEVGQVYWHSSYADRRYRFVVLAVDTDRQEVEAIAFRRSEIREHTRYTFARLQSDWRIDNEPPESIMVGLRVGQHMLGVMREVEVERDRLREQIRQLNDITTNMVSVSVRLTGQVDVQPSDDTVRQTLNDQGVEIVRRRNALISWRKDVQVPKRGVGCQCAALTREDVRPMVPTGTTTWDHEVRGCSEHNSGAVASTGF